MEDQKAAQPTNWITEVKQYGPAAVVLVLLGLWLKPHFDNLIVDHREFLKQTTITQQQQAQTQAVGVQVLQKLESKTDDSNSMLREIRTRVDQAAK